jgi:hypothetical protein
VRALCRPAPPSGGELELALAGSAGTWTVPFGAQPVGDGEAGVFAFTVPAGAPVASVEVRRGGQVLARRAAAHPGGSLGEPQWSAREADGVLQLTWDPRLHPYATVVHEGATRTTLAMNLTGGSAALPLDRLPEGGRFLLHFSDGLNTVRQALTRQHLAAP